MPRAPGATVLRLPARWRGSIADGPSLAVVVAACVLVLWAAAAPPALGASHSRGSAAASAHRLSSTPPVPLGATGRSSQTSSASTEHASGTAAAAGTATRLPATGYDAVRIALLGLGMVAAGLGLRRLSGDVRRV